MKKTIFILLFVSLILLPLYIYADEDPSSIFVTQSVSSTPDQDGQYSVSVEGYVKGTSSTTTTLQASDITLLLDLSKRDKSSQEIEVTTWKNTDTGFDSGKDCFTYIKNNGRKRTDLYENGQKKDFYSVKYEDYYYLKNDIKNDVYINISESYYINITYGSATSTNVIFGASWSSLATKDVTGYAGKLIRNNTTYSLATDVPTMARTLVTSILSDGSAKSLQHNVRIVGFSGSDSNTSTVLCDWTTNGTTMMNATNNASATTASVTPSPSTGLNAVNTRNGSTNEQVVVMITDGSRWTASVTKPSALNDATIYCVSTTSLDGTHAGYLNTLCSPLTYTANAVPTNFPPTVEEQVVTAAPAYSLMGSSAKIELALADGFTFPDNCQFTVKTDACTGVTDNEPTFGNSPQGISDNIASKSGRVVTITSFDFSDNWCGKNGTENHGKKLIVTFPVVTTVDNTGGSDKSMVSSITVTNQNSQQVTGFTSSTATVNLPNLYIQASGVNDNENCLFTVTGTSGSWSKTFTVMTTGSTAVKLQAMPEGTYTITPKSWPWAYNLPEAQQNVSLTGNGTTLSFTFTPKSITTPHHGEATASTPAN